MGIDRISSEVDICNKALGHLKQDLIASIDPPTNVNAQRCALAYRPALRAALRRHPWNFAKAQYELTPSSTPPIFKFTHAYQLPNDFIRLLKLYTSDEFEIKPTQYDLQGRKIFYNGADNTAIYMEYVFEQTDISKYDDLFIEVFAVDMAIELAPNFSGNEARVRTLIDIRKDLMTEARAIDGQEKPPVRKQESKWIRARRGIGRINNGASPYLLFE